MARIHLRRLVVENVGRFDRLVDLSDLAPGINLITGRNEAGKSTLVEALRCAMFERHNARHAQIKALQPYSGLRLAPRVLVELTLGGQPVSIEKRFLEGASSELKQGDNLLLTGAEADTKLFELLGARAPGRQGSKDEHMGMWRLLWLSQDETARVEPGERIDGETRGRLHEVIEGQVGQLMGGREIERVCQMVSDRYALFWTPETGVATGDFAKTRERVEELEREVERIRSALAQTEDLGRQIEDAALAREGAERQESLLRAEFDEAQRLAGESEQLSVRLSQARAEHDLSASELQRIMDQLRARTALEKRLEWMRKDIEGGLSVQKELESQVAWSKADVERRESELQAREDELSKTGHDYANATSTFQHATSVEAAERLLRMAEEANGLRHRAREIDLQLKEQSISTEAYRELQKLDGEFTRLERICGINATQLLVRSGPDESEPYTVLSERQIDTVEGVVLIRPARLGLAQATLVLRAAEVRREEALRAAGAVDLSSARKHRTARQLLEADLQGCERDLEETAPAGLDTLLSSAERARGLETEKASALQRAQAAEVRARELSQSLEDQRVTSDALTRLREQAQHLELARSRRDALGTRVSIRALEDLELSHPDAGPQALGSDEQREFIVSHATSFEVRGVLSLSIEPLGGDLAHAESEVERARVALERELAALGISDLVSATEAARQRGQAEDSLRQALQQIEQDAPEGVEPLRLEAQKASAARQELERRCAVATVANARSVELRDALAANPVSREALEHLEQLDGEAQMARHAAQALAAELVLPNETEVRLILEETAGSNGALHWKVTPHEVAPESVHQLELLRATYSERLADLNLADIEAARERRSATSALELERASLQAQLSNLTRSGLGLYVDVPTARARLEDLGPLEASMDDAHAALAVAQNALAVQTEQCRDARIVLEQARAQYNDWRIQYAERHATTTQAEAAERDVSDELVELRRSESDAELGTRLTRAEQQHDEAIARMKDLESELELAGHQDAKKVAERAEIALEACRMRMQAEREKLAGFQAKLELIRAEGRFESLSDVEAELTHLRSVLARLTREAEAVKLLSRLVKEEHAKAQRRLLEPLVGEIRPYLATLRPNTEIQISPELKVEKLVRRGVEENLGQLSGGTREQLSIIVRLGLAQVLAKEGHVFPLILDDTLGWTDDHRFAQMVKILSAAAERMQIIVLSCHPMRFEKMGTVRRFDLDGDR